MEWLYEYDIPIEMTHTNLTPLTSDWELGKKYLPTTNTDYRANSFQLHFLNNYFNGSYPIKILKQLHFQILLCERTGWSNK